MTFQMPTSRYVLPQFLEETSFGTKQIDPYGKLFEERIVFLGTQVDDTSANDIMAQLLVLESQDPDRDITMYINSPGGSFTALMAIYDTMQYVRPDVQTLAHHSGRTPEQVRIDTDRDKILTAAEAKEYGIIDQVFDYRKLNA